jgi:hypothetical protein
MAAIATLLTVAPALMEDSTVAANAVLKSSLRKRHGATFNRGTLLGPTGAKNLNCTRARALVADPHALDGLRLHGGRPAGGDPLASDMPLDLPTLVIAMEALASVAHLMYSHRANGRGFSEADEAAFTFYSLVAQAVVAMVDPGKALSVHWHNLTCEIPQFLRTLAWPLACLSDETGERLLKLFCRAVRHFKPDPALFTHFLAEVEAVKVAMFMKNQRQQHARIPHPDNPNLIVCCCLLERTPSMLGLWQDIFRAYPASVRQHSSGKAFLLEIGTHRADAPGQCRFLCVGMPGGCTPPPRDTLLATPWLPSFTDMPRNFTFGGALKVPPHDGSVPVPLEEQDTMDGSDLEDSGSDVDADMAYLRDGSMAHLGALVADAPSPRPMAFLEMANDGPDVYIGAVCADDTNKMVMTHYIPAAKNKRQKVGRGMVVYTDCQRVCPDCASFNGPYLRKVSEVQPLSCTWVQPPGGDLIIRKTDLV